MPNVACFMIQRNERSLLEPWLLYHGHLFGFQNLYVWDNGSTDDAILPIIEKYGHRGVNFMDGARRPERYGEKGILFGNKIKELERFGYYDFFLPLDCDEFVCLRQTAEGEIVTQRERILARFDALDPCQSLFKVGYNFPNNLRRPGYFFGWDFNKRFVRRDVFDRMDHGGHSIETRRPMDTAESDLAYIHFCYRSYAEARENATNKMRLRGGAENWTQEQLREHRIGRILTMSEEEYLDSFDLMNSNTSYRAPGLERFFAQYGRRLPFC